MPAAVWSPSRRRSSRVTGARCRELADLPSAVELLLGGPAAIHALREVAEDALDETDKFVDPEDFKLALLCDLRRCSLPAVAAQQLLLVTGEVLRALGVLEKYWRGTGKVLERCWRGTGEVLQRYDRY